MNAHELSDPDADALTITTRGAKTWITSTSGGEEVTVGPFATDAITGALPADPMDGGVTAALIEQELEREAQPSSAAPSPGLLEAALKAALDAERTACEERDEARATKNMHKERADRERARADRMEQERDKARNNEAQAVKRAADYGFALTRLARALDLPDTATTDQMVERLEEINGAGRTVTDEMVERARDRGREVVGVVWDHEVVDAMLTAALIEPRPHGPATEEAPTIAAFCTPDPNQVRVMLKHPAFGTFDQRVHLPNTMTDVAADLSVSFSSTEMLIEHPLIGRHARPLDIPVSDEMVEQFQDAWQDRAQDGARPSWHLVKAGLRAALTQLPTRPAGAEKFDPIVDAAIRGHSDITSPTVVHAIADALAEEGASIPAEDGAA